MLTLRRVSAVLAASALYICTPGCSTGTDELAGATDADLGTVSPAAIVGELAVGATSEPIAFTSTPTYRALSFSANKGDRIEAWVRSSNGDAVAWITDADFKSLAGNDDAGPATHDSHVEAVIEKTGKQYVVFRERDGERATFTVSLSAGDLPGTACTTQDQLTKRACGFCGTKTSVCERGATGALVWSDFSPCEGEHGVCQAGTTRTGACGNCGTRTETCSNSCNWSAGACSAAPATGCVPGSFDITNAGCPQAFSYRVRECSATCSYASFGACGPAPTRIEVGPTVGSLSSTVAILDGALARISSNVCPATLLAASTAYAYVQVHNPNAKAMTVSLFHSVAPQGPAFDTAIAVYASPSAPTSVDERRSCLKASNIGTASLTGDAKFASLDTASKRVTIPAGETYTVYNTAESATMGARPVRLNVKTESVGE